MNTTTEIYKTPALKQVHPCSSSTHDLIHLPPIVRAERRVNQQIRKDLLNQRRINRSTNRILNGHRNKLQVCTFRFLIARSQNRHQRQYFAQYILFSLVTLMSSSRWFSLIGSPMGGRGLKTGPSRIVRMSSRFAENQRVAFGSGGGGGRQGLRRLGRCGGCDGITWTQ